MPFDWGPSRRPRSHAPQGVAHGGGHFLPGPPYPTPPSWGLAAAHQLGAPALSTSPGRGADAPASARSPAILELSLSSRLQPTWGSTEHLSSRAAPPLPGPRAERAQGPGAGPGAFEHPRVAGPLGTSLWNGLQSLGCDEGLGHGSPGSTGASPQPPPLEPPATPASGRLWPWN